MIAISSLVSILAAPIAGIAQESEDSSDEMEIEEIVITGIRSSLKQSADIKRFADGVVDAITAEDIGKFPDSNLAESLQRITGVSVDRRNGEGNQISVRGFGPSFNLVTLNGRQMPGASSPKQENASSANVPRSFNFSEIAAESVSGVEVFKTANVLLPSGGIGATVNLRTARPMDFKGFRATVSTNGLMDTSNKLGNDITPEFGGLVSYSTENGKFGVLLNGTYSERDSRERLIATDGWIRGNSADASAAGIDSSAINATANPTGSIWVPRNLLVDASDHERKRINGQAVVQFRPVDTLTITADFTYSKYEDDIIRNQTAVWFQQDTITGRTDSNGTVINPTVTANPAAGLGAMDFNSYYDQVKTENKSLGINLEWEATDNLTLTVDLHDSKSHAQPNGESTDFLVILASPLGVDYSADYSGSTQVPVFSYDDSALANGAFDANNLRPNIDLKRGNENKNTIQQIQFKVDWNNSDGGLIENIQAGIDYVDYKINTGFLFDLNVQGTPNCGSTCASLVEMTSIGDIGDPFTGGNSLPPYFMYNNAQEVFDSMAVNFPSVFSLKSIDVNEIREETTSGFVQFNFSDDFNGMAFRGNAGVRYEHTETTSQSEFFQPIGMQWLSPTELRPVNDTEETFREGGGSYDVFLPSINTSLEVMDDTLVRLSYGRTLSRNDLLQLRATLAISDSRPGCNQGASCSANQGNPSLKPYISDNFDLSVEKYFSGGFFGEGSYLAVNYFRKYVENFVTFNTVQDQIVGGNGQPLTDPNPSNDPTATAGIIGGPSDEVIIWDITQPTNGEAAQVDGWELAAQLFLGDTGFGLQANYTKVNGDISFDKTDITSQVAITGLSDTFNLVGFYEKDRFQARVAYNWRDEFLMSTEQLRQPQEPVFVNSYWQIDASVSYEINDTVTVYAEGINLTNQTSSAHGRFDNQFIYAVETGPRYSIGARAKF